MFVEKSRPKPVDLHSLNAPETYDGINTPLFHVSEHSKRFLCEFNGISQYPFIKDTCSFYLYLDGSGNKLTTVRASIEAPTNKIIGQYVLSDWEIKSNERNISEVNEENGEDISLLDKGSLQHHSGHISPLSPDEHHQPGHQLHHR